MGGIQLIGVWGSWPCVELCRLWFRGVQRRIGAGLTGIIVGGGAPLILPATGVPPSTPPRGHALLRWMLGLGASLEGHACTGQDTAEPHGIPHFGQG
jgi:hypothetical protein